MSSKDRVVPGLFRRPGRLCLNRMDRRQAGREVVAVARRRSARAAGTSGHPISALDCASKDLRHRAPATNLQAEYCMPALKASALTKAEYPLVSALSPRHRKHLVGAP